MVNTWQAELAARQLRFTDVLDIVALTPGRQRGYLLHFAAAKQAKTRSARGEKYMPQILIDKGLDD